MNTITKLGQETAENYYREEFANRLNSYMTENGKLAGVWQGKLAEELGLAGTVTEETYIRLMRGQHPATGEQLIRSRPSYENKAGEIIEHVPAWDFTLSAPKSISVAALVGGDVRLLRVVEDANRAALEAGEKYVQARGGGNAPPITTGKWIVATFRHDTARPVGDYAAPQLHFHNVVPNLVREYQTDEQGKFRALSTKELYRVSSLMTMAFRSHILGESRKLGYEMRIDAETGAPEIKGFSKEYLLSQSLRAQAIEAKLDELGGDRERFRQIARLQTREAKLNLSPDELRSAWAEHAKLFGCEADGIISKAIARGESQPMAGVKVERAVDHARTRHSERKAVFEHWEVVRDALKYGKGTLSVKTIEAEIDRRVESGTLLPVSHYREYAPGARYTTPEIKEMEAETIEAVTRGIGRVAPISRNADLANHPDLHGNAARAALLEGFLKTTDQITALNGTAGSAKSTAAGILGPIAKANGFIVHGLAPTGRARDSLAEKGIASETLQMHLIRSRNPEYAERGKTLFILDEASLASNKMMRDFTLTLQPKDHVILIGDDAPDKGKVGQHTSVEAGRIFQALQEAGMKTAHLNKVFRHKTAELKEVVANFRVGNTGRAVELLTQQGNVKEFSSNTERYRALAEEFTQSPKTTLIVSPDNKSRQAINVTVRQVMQEKKILAPVGFGVSTLVSRDVTGIDRALVSNYRVGDVIQYRREQKALKLEAKSYATVLDRDTETNRLTVKTDCGKTIQYDPAIFGRGCSVYQAKQQEFAVGDRIQFTTSSTKLGVSTRDLATIQQIEANGNIMVEVDRSGRTVPWNLKDFRHIDYAYTMTSHSAQSMTVERTLVHVDTEDTRLRMLVNKVFAYVATSRSEHELKIFTDSREKLVGVLSRENEAQKGHSPGELQGFKTGMDKRRGIEYVQETSLTV